MPDKGTKKKILFNLFFLFEWYTKFPVKKIMIEVIKDENTMKFNLTLQICCFNYLMKRVEISVVQFWLSFLFEKNLN